METEEILELIKLIDQTNVNEFSYKNKDSKIIIRKSNMQLEASEVEQVETSPNQSILHEPTQLKEQPKKSEVVFESEQVQDNQIKEIVSPMVGTFYRKPSPESNNYVEIGNKVDESTVVCIVEAMKLFNEIEAEINGQIVEVLVEDGELVEYGQPLFNVKTN